ncbi:MAG: hypothetical protein RR704_22960 [Stenotrophomonas sp.]
MDASPPLPPPLSPPVLPPNPAAPVFGPQDATQLRQLAIAHYVVAGLIAVFSLIFVLHIALGIAMLTGSLPMKSGGNPPSPEDQQIVGWMFTVMGTCIVLGGLTLAGFMAYAGRCLSRQRRYLLCMIVAGLSCLFTPIGTILGVFSLVVLLRPQVKAAFAAST